MVLQAGQQSMWNWTLLAVVRHWATVPVAKSSGCECSAVFRFANLFCFQERWSWALGRGLVGWALGGICHGGFHYCLTFLRGGQQSDGSSPFVFFCIKNKRIWSGNIWIEWVRFCPFWKVGWVKSWARPGCCCQAMCCLAFEVNSRLIVSLLRQSTSCCIIAQLMSARSQRTKLVTLPWRRLMLSASNASDSQKPHAASSRCCRISSRVPFLQTSKRAFFQLNN